MDVSLVIENIDSLELALQQFVSPETMDTENKIYCDVCKCNTKSSKFFRSSFWPSLSSYCYRFKQLPLILTVQLKRFQYDYRSNRRFKLNNKVPDLPLSYNTFKVTFPTYLDMRNYLDTNANTEDTIYELFSVLLHSGGAFGGTSWHLDFVYDCRALPSLCEKC